MSQPNSSKSAEAKRNLKASNKKSTKLIVSKPKLVNSNITNNNNETKDITCDICAQNVPGPEREEIFAFGKCDHYVCYVCSTRLRVICDQSECPICREKLDNVSVFSSKYCFFQSCLTYNELPSSHSNFNR